MLPEKFWPSDAKLKFDVLILRSFLPSTFSCQCSSNSPENQRKSRRNLPEITREQILGVLHPHTHPSLRPWH